MKIKAYRSGRVVIGNTKGAELSECEFWYSLVRLKELSTRIHLAIAFLEGDNAEVRFF